MSGDGGEFVGAGAFKLDRGRALAKLRRFQASPLVEISELWLRVAVTSGAGYFSMGRRMTSGEYRFDGRPIPLARLREPYRALFDAAAPAGERARWFALALINSFGPHVKSLEVISGAAGRRRKLRAVAPGAERVSPSDEPGIETIVRFSWPLFTLGWAGMPNFDWASGIAPIRIIERGQLFPSEKGGEETGPAEAKTVDGCRVHVGGFTVGISTGPRFWLGHHGVRVGKLTGIKAPLSVSGWIDSPFVTLNASLSKAVENEALARARAILQREVDKALLSRVHEPL